MVTEQQQRSNDRNSVSGDSAEWLIEYDFDRTGEWHMRRDEELARERIEDSELPNILRLYSWQPAAVSIGFQQKLESVDLEACRRDGVDVVRRPTGGRAVLHANELTYAVILRSEPGDGIYAVHSMIVDALLRSLEGLGPEFSRLTLTARSSDTNFKEVYRPGTLTNAACFASSARHEVTVAGKKVIGSAQRRFGDVVLQHGSILLNDSHLALPQYLVLPEVDRERMLLHLQRETTTLSAVFERPIGIEEAANSISSRFLTHICTPIEHAI